MPTFASNDILNSRVEMVDSGSWEVKDLKVASLIFGGQDVNIEMPSVLYPFKGIEHAIIPVTAFEKMFNAKVSWDAKTSRVKISSEDNTKVVSFELGKSTLEFNGETYSFPYKMPARALTYNGETRTMVPAGVVEYFGYEYHWNNESRAIEIEYPIQSIKDVIWDESGRFSEIHIPTTGKIATTSYYLDGSKFGGNDKIIVDLPNTKFDIPSHKLTRGERVIDFLYGDIKQIVAFKVPNENKTRIQIEVENRRGYDVFYDARAKQVVIRFINSVRDVQLEEIYSTPTVVINTGEYPAYNVIRLEDRIVLDVMNSLMKYNNGISKVDTVNIDGIKSISYLQYDTTYDRNYSKEDIVSRIVIELEEGMSSEDIYVENIDNEIFVYIYGNPLDGIDYVKNSRSESMLSMKFDSAVVVKPSYTSKTNTLSFEVPANVINFEDMNVDFDDGVVQNVVVKANVNNKHKIYIKLAKGTQVRDANKGKQSEELQLYFVNNELKNSVWKNTFVVIDAGHGGSDPGAIGSKITESTLTLRAAKALEKRLSGIGFKTYMIRDADVTIARSYRKRIANELGADLVISIHFNASNNPKARGVEVLYADEPTGLKKKFAGILQKRLIETLGMVDRGIVHRPNLYMCYAPKMPSVLVELGFVTNEQEQEFIMTKNFMNKATEALTNGIIEFLKLVKH